MSGLRLTPVQSQQDKTVLIWTKDTPTGAWTKTALDPNPSSGNAKFPDTVWRVSWSLAGNILAVSCGDGKVTPGFSIPTTGGAFALLAEADIPLPEDEDVDL